jgi:hypothetical protein
VGCIVRQPEEGEGLIPVHAFHGATSGLAANTAIFMANADDSTVLQDA